MNHEKNYIDTIMNMFVWRRVCPDSTENNLV